MADNSKSIPVLRQVYQSLATPEEKTTYLTILGMPKAKRMEWIAVNAPALNPEQRTAILGAMGLTKEERIAIGGMVARNFLMRILGKIFGF
jgi:hypothetical protein